MSEISMIPDTSPLITDDLKKQMKPLFNKMSKKVQLNAVLDLENEKSIELGSFLKAIVSCSDKLELKLFEKDENLEIQNELHGEHLPVVGIYLDDIYTGACFHGTPGGKEINSFIAAVCNVGGAAQPLDKRTKKKIDLIERDVNIIIFVSLACHHCPHVVAACQKIAVASSHVTAEMYDARLYPDIVEKYHIERVPMTLIDGKTILMGQKTIDEILDKIHKKI